MRLTKNTHNQGFSLIELLITAAVIAFLSLLGTSMTISWIDGNKVQQSIGLFNKSLTYAKSNAISNAKGLNDISIMHSAICIFEEHIEARTTHCNISSAAAKLDQQILWRDNFPKDMNITLTRDDSRTVQCACFNYKGTLTTAGVCAACLQADTIRLTFTKGSTHATATYF